MDAPPAQVRPLITVGERPSGTLDLPVAGGHARWCSGSPGRARFRVTPPPTHPTTLTLDENGPMTNPAAPPDTQLGDALAALTLEEKVQLLTGRDFWTTWPLERIGLRRILVLRRPVRRPRRGVGRARPVAQPARRRPPWPRRGTPTSPARYGAAAAVEARRKGVDVVLGPTINLHRSPLGGRHFECFSEDPVLTARARRRLRHAACRTTASARRRSTTSPTTSRPTASPSTSASTTARCASCTCCAVREGGRRGRAPGR